jgi:hypothetical protein
MIDEDNPIGSEEEEGDDDFPIRSTPLYVVLVCGLIIAAIGLYLAITGQVAGGPAGMIRPGRSLYGTYVYNGTSLLILGLLICVYPVYQLRKNSNRDSIR